MIYVHIRRTYRISSRVLQFPITLLSFIIPDHDLMLFPDGALLSAFNLVVKRPTMDMAVVEPFNK